MKIRGERVPGRSGTLYQRTKKKQLQNGQTKEYPLVLGERDPQNVRHWFWQLTYNPHSALQLLRHILVTKTRQFDDTTDRNSLIAVTQN